MLLISLTDLNFLVTPPFYKIQSLISVALSSGIIFLLRAVCFPSPHDADVGENRLHDHDQLKECLCVELGLLFYASSLSVSLSFTVIKLFLYT